MSLETHVSTPKGALLPRLCCLQSLWVCVCADRRTLTVCWRCCSVPPQSSTVDLVRVASKGSGGAFGACSTYAPSLLLRFFFSSAGSQTELEASLPRRYSTSAASPKTERQSCEARDCCSGGAGIGGVAAQTHWKIYVDEVQDLTQAEMSVLSVTCFPRSCLFLAGEIVCWLRGSIPLCPSALHRAPAGGVCAREAHDSPHQRAKPHRDSRPGKHGFESPFINLPGSARASCGWTRASTRARTPRADARV